MVETNQGSTDSARIRFQNIFETIDLGVRKTKVICTLGPACWDTDMLVKMLDAGMNVARLNFSHGDHVSHGKSVANLKDALKQRPDKTCAIMLDTKGPEIRTGLLVDHQPIEITAGQSLQIVTDYAIEGDNTRISCSYQALPETVQVGSLIYVADGSLTCEVTEIQEVSSTASSRHSILLDEINNYKIFLRDRSECTFNL
ncbi:MAG: hypothetical protein GY849_22075 [Deltaproteobacteria bacterium]|nr:hypothetical protein [Deltaproteobacteria bacterium]